MIHESAQYGWQNPHPTCAHQYLLAVVLREIHALSSGKSMCILDIGCGNGYVASQLAKNGHSVIGVDASPDGIEIARRTHPEITFEMCSVYDDVLTRIGRPVDCVVTLEVVEHLFYPKALFRQALRVLQPGGHLILSTPYHGYFKNLALSIVNGWDRHFGVDWDGGHIKFFSKKTIAQMASHAGFKNLRFQGAGRFPGLWKSMVMTAEK